MSCETQQLLLEWGIACIIGAAIASFVKRSNLTKRD